jgi:hypothetical protein
LNGLSPNILKGLRSIARPGCAPWRREPATAQLPWLLERGGELSGYLPLSEVHSPLFGGMLASSGFGVGGAACSPWTSDQVTALLGGLEELALRRSCPTAELRGGMLPKARAGWKIRHDSHCGFVAPLAADDEAQLLAIPRKQRAEVRKGLAERPDRRKLAARAGDRAAHYAVYAESVRNLGTPVFPRVCSMPCSTPLARTPIS